MDAWAEQTGEFTDPTHLNDFFEAHPELLDPSSYFPGSGDVPQEYIPGATFSTDSPGRNTVLDTAGAIGAAFTAAAPLAARIVRAVAPAFFPARNPPGRRSTYASAIRSRAPAQHHRQRILRSSGRSRRQLGLPSLQRSRRRRRDFVSRTVYYSPARRAEVQYRTALRHADARWWSRQYRYLHALPPFRPSWR